MPDTRVKPDQAIAGVDREPDGFITTMRVRQRDTQELPKESMAKLKAQAQDPSVFDEGTPPYVFDLVSSTNDVDSYGTRMQPSTLKNYVSDAQSGVALLYGHNKREIPHGHIFDGTFKDARTTGGPLAQVTAFMPRDVELNGRSNNDLITLVRMGQLSDTSVSFYGGRIVCSLDQKEMLDIWDLLFGDYERGEVCEHIPGMMYDWQGTRQMAIGLVEDAHMSETSLVYDGSTPGAAVVKGKRMAEAGKLPFEVGNLIEARYHVRLPGMYRVVQLDGTMTKTREQTEERPAEGEAAGGGAADAAGNQSAAAAANNQPAADTNKTAGEVAETPAGESPPQNTAAKKEDEGQGAGGASSAEGEGDRAQDGRTPAWQFAAGAGFPIGPDREWDGSKAESHIFEWAGWTSDKTPDGGGKARQCFAAYDANNSGTKGGYRLPFCEIIDGAPHAMPAGIRAAKSRASQSGADLPQSVKDDFVAMCDRYLEKMNGSNGQTEGATREQQGHDSNGEDAEMDRTRQVLVETGLAPDGFSGDPYEFIRTTVAERAKDGSRYRSDMIAEALTEGRRLYGERFNEEVYTGVLQRSSLDEIKRMRDDWSAQADPLFTRGRRTTDGAQQPDGATQHTADGQTVVTIRPPADAFRG